MVEYILDTFTSEAWRVSLVVRAAGLDYGVLGSNLERLVFFVPFLR